MFEEFDHLEWGSMTIFKYETHFHTLSKYSVASISIEFEWIKKFIKGLYDNYHLCTTYMIVSRDLFQSIIEHAKTIESIIQDTPKGTKKVCRHSEFSGHASRGRDFSSKSSRSYHGSIVQATLQGSGGKASGSTTLGSQAFDQGGSHSSFAAPPQIQLGYRGCFIWYEFDHVTNDYPQRVLNHVEKGQIREIQIEDTSISIKVRDN